MAAAFAAAAGPAPVAKAGPKKGVASLAAAFEASPGLKPAPKPVHTPSGSGRGVQAASASSGGAVAAAAALQQAPPPRGPVPAPAHAPAPLQRQEPDVRSTPADAPRAPPAVVRACACSPRIAHELLSGFRCALWRRQYARTARLVLDSMGFGGGFAQAASDGQVAESVGAAREEPGAGGAKRPAPPGTRGPRRLNVAPPGTGKPE